MAELPVSDAGMPGERWRIAPGVARPDAPLGTFFGDEGRGANLAAVLTVIFGAATARVWFWWYTRFTIEDGLIYARIVRNLAAHGLLSFNLHERVSTATSPLFALLAGLVSCAGVDPAASGKVLGLAGGIGGALLVFFVLKNFAPLSVSLAGASFAMLLPPLVVSAVNGMETSLYSWMVFWSLERSWRGHPRAAVLLGTAATAFRPDGVLVLLVVLGFSYVREGRSWLKVARNALPGAVIILAMTGLHLLYFGQILPQSVVAKTAGYQVNPLSNSAAYLYRMFLYQPTGLPVYALAVVGVWSALKRDRWLSVFVVWYAVYHVFFMLRAPLFDWYLQSPLIVLSLFAGLGLAEAYSWIPQRWLRRPATKYEIAAVTGVILVGLSAGLYRYAGSKARGQRYEDEVRAAAGKWLHQHCSPGEVGFTESLGYIGYYSDIQLIDFPGLTSPEVSKLLKHVPVSSTTREAYDSIIGKFAPVWLILRDAEWGRLDSRLRAQYVPVMHFHSRYSGQPSYTIARRK